MGRTGAVCLLFAAAAAAAGDSVRLKGKVVRVAPPFPTQRTEFVLFRAVKDAIVRDGERFPVAAGKKSLKVALKPGAKPGKSVRASGGFVKLAGGVPLYVRRHAERGWEYAAAGALEFELDRVAFRVLDANADGRFEPGKDAWQLPPWPFVLPLPRELVVGRRKLAIESIEGRVLTGRAGALAGSRHQLDGLVAINDLRMSVGLPTTTLDAELSAACTAHARYLLLNKWTPATNPHFEIRGRRGYTEAGHRAGMMSVIAWSDHAGAVPGHWITYYHRFSFQHPLLKGVGISDGTPSISIIDGKSGVDRDADFAGWRDPVLVPADGSVGVPAGFHRGGERPSPVENAGSRGFPLTVLFLAPSPGVTSFRGELVRLSRKGEEPVKTLVPRSNNSRHRFGLIPERPLRSNGRYRVRYRFERDGEPETVTATFQVK